MHVSKSFGAVSEENRKNLKYQTTIAVLGSEYGSFNPITASLGYFIDHNSLISFRYSNHNISDVAVVEKMRATTLGFRNFLGNSFNIMPTVYWRRTNIDDTQTANRRFIYEDFGIGVRLGNEWQWENFTMGCDWIGMNRALKVLNKDNRSKTFFDSDDKESINMTFLSFYLGYSF